jgi:hypothetical protein
MTNFKNHRVVSNKLRRFAQDKECTLGLKGICNGDPATTVHAHLRKFGQTGFNQKPQDIHGFHTCSDCHLYEGLATFEELLRAVVLTQIRLVNAGIIKVEGDKKTAHIEGSD